MGTTKETPQRKLVVLEEGVLTNMAQNPKFLAEFPFLARLSRMARNQPSGCGSCAARRANQSRAAAYQEAKNSLVGLSPEKRQVLKKMLNTHRVRIIYNTPAGQRIARTF